MTTTSTSFFIGPSQDRRADRLFGERNAWGPRSPSGCRPGAAQVLGSSLRGALSRGGSWAAGSAAGDSGGSWAGSGGRRGARTTSGRATHASSRGCGAAHRPRSPVCMRGTRPASTTSPCEWSGTRPTRRTSPRTCSSARSNGSPGTARSVLRPWLYRLTLNRCYDYLRGAARRPLVAAPGREVASPHDLFEQSELQGLLEASIGDLTPRQRAALLLKDVHGLSLSEVAGCLEVTPGSVEVLLARARRAFRASYEERCVAAGRPLPRSAGGLAMLPMLPLPAGLAAPAAVPLAPPHMPVVAPPLTLATGGGIGAVLGLPASVKTAVLVAAAAATVGTAEIAVTHADRRPPRHAVVAAVVVVPTPPRSRPAPALTPRCTRRRRPRPRRPPSPRSLRPPANRCRRPRPLSSPGRRLREVRSASRALRRLPSRPSPRRRPPLRRRRHLQRRRRPRRRLRRRRRARRRSRARRRRRLRRPHPDARQPLRRRPRWQGLRRG